MQSLYNFVVEPIGGRYNNTTKVGDKELIVNNDVSSHEHKNRYAKVVSVPKLSSTKKQGGENNIVHYNEFRRWNNVTG